MWRGGDEGTARTPQPFWQATGETNHLVPKARSQARSLRFYWGVALNR